MDKNKNPLAQNLRYLRMKYDYSQEYLAEYIEVSRNMYLRYEAGLSYPALDKLLRIADCFHLPISVLTHINLSDNRRKVSAIFDSENNLPVFDDFRSLSLLSKKIVIEETHFLHMLESRFYDSI